VSAAFSSDGKFVASGSLGVIDVWRVADHQHLKSLSQPGLWMQHVAISPDGQRVAGAHGDRVWIWDLSTAAELAVIEKTSSVSQLAFSPDSSALVTVVGRQEASVWSLSDLPVANSETATPSER
jgi:WD40 repeat protein